MVDSDIISALYPSYIAQFLIGCAPFKISKSRNGIKITERRIYDRLTTVLVLMVISFICCRYYVMDLKDFNNNSLLKFMTTSYFVVVGGLITTNFISTRTKKPAIVKLWMELYEIDKNIRSTGIKLKYSTIKWSSVRFLSLGFSSITTYMIYLLTSQNFKNRLQGYVTYGSLYLGALHYISFTCSFLTLIRSTVEMTEQLLKKVDNVLVCKSTQKVPLSKLMILHQQLFDLLQLIGQVFATQILLSFAISFTLITFQSYSILCAVHNHSRYLRYSFASIIWIVVVTVDKMAVTFACHKCMFRVSLKCFWECSIFRNFSVRLYKTGVGKICCCALGEQNSRQRGKFYSSRYYIPWCCKFCNNKETIIFKMHIIFSKLLKN
jgi:hypothetical protein